MISITKCQRYDKNTSGMLKQTAKVELSKHSGVECICSSAFTKFMELHELGKAPITTKELMTLIMAL